MYLEEQKQYRTRELTKSEYLKFVMYLETNDLRVPYEMDWSNDSYTITLFEPSVTFWDEVMPHLQDKS